MKKLLSLVVVCALLAGGYLLLRPRVVWLDFFEGTIVAKIEDEVATVGKSIGQRISKYYLDIKTDSGRQVRVPVEQLTYFDSDEGMRVHKGPFTTSIELLSP